MLLRDVKLRALQRRTVQPFLSGAAVLLKFQKRKVVLDWTHCRATRPRRCGFHWNGVTLHSNPGSLPALARALSSLLSNAASNAGSRACRSQAPPATPGVEKR